MSDKIKLTLDQIEKLVPIALRNGTQDAAIAILLQWARQADEAIAQLRELLTIYVHAHATGSSVRSFIEAKAKEALKL